MPPEDIPEDSRQSFPCECGGNITEEKGIWSCNTCNFSAEAEEI